MKQDAKYVRWFEEIRIGDIPIVGGKNASLGEMYRELASQGVKIPNGFAVTAEAYWHVIESAGILDELKGAMLGLHETYLNIRGYPELKEACSKCLASLFTNRAISYRIDNNFDHFQVALSIGIMKMVRSDLATSGVIFTIDTETE